MGMDLDEEVRLGTHLYTHMSVSPLLSLLFLPTRKDGESEVARELTDAEQQEQWELRLQVQHTLIHGGGGLLGCDRNCANYFVFQCIPGLYVEDKDGGGCPTFVLDKKCSPL